MRTLALALSSLLLGAGSASADELAGPGRFCGYSPIIDLLPGERIVTLGGGMHGGSFRWDGNFGSLEVAATGWASRPRGQMTRRATDKGHAQFKEWHKDGRYTVAIWNRARGAAYFSSPRPLTQAQLAAINRVDLFDEGQEPTKCDLRTVFTLE